MEHIKDKQFTNLRYDKRTEYLVSH